MKLRKNKKIINYIFIIFLILSSTILFNNKTIEKEKITNNKLKALEQEGQSYRLVTSADNVQVPVPKGYVASQATGENYVTPEYQHTINTYKVESTPTELTWSSPDGEQYPWTQDSNGIWISGNQRIPSSESVLESEEFNYVKGTTLTINYTYSSANNDFLNIYIINLANNMAQRIIYNKYGNTDTSFDYTTSNYTYTMNDWGTGRYKIRATYSKNASANAGQDSAYIKTSTYYKKDENGTETFEEDIKTKIHDGGFVIYQLTDEELETDPNGTGVIINDTNKDIAQSIRNQYVWVPVPNIEDIVRTKVVNNGIIQFGQIYIFSTTSITKETNTGTNYYREPRLVEQCDIIKYYLQRYSNIDKRASYLNKMQENYGRMIKSINKYKGFYIGRYETGDDYEHDSNKKCFINPRVVRYNQNINYVTWYDSYDKLKRLAGKTGKYVETGMIYDSLWDYTLKWINETDARSYEEIGSDGKSWGNYYNNINKYKESSNGTEIIKNAGSDSIIPTGGIIEITYEGEIYSDFPSSSDNIFDIAGNVSEWTSSKYSDNYRGGRGDIYNISSSNSPAKSFSGSSPIGSVGNRETRSVLLVR